MLRTTTTPPRRLIHRIVWHVLPAAIAAAVMLAPGVLALASSDPAPATPADSAARSREWPKRRLAPEWQWPRPAVNVDHMFRRIGR